MARGETTAGAEIAMQRAAAPRRAADPV